MSNPFSAVLERTAPTPKKCGDENTLHNSGSNEVAVGKDLGMDCESSLSPADFKGGCATTPQTGHRVARSNSMRKMDSPAPPLTSVGRARSASNREVATTPLKDTICATTPHKRSIQKLGRTVGTPGTGVRTPGVSRTRSSSNKEFISNSALKSTTPGHRKAYEKSAINRQAIAKPKVKTLDKALRESLSGYMTALEGKSAIELAQLEDAEKRRRESVNRLRNRNSICRSSDRSEVDNGEGSLTNESGNSDELEKAARRQSVVVLNEFRQLVEAASSELIESEKAGEEEEGGNNKKTILDTDEAGDRRRESMALDQALVRQMLPRKVCVPLRQGKKVPPEAFQGVSIFFSDVVGFTKISAEVEPIKVHELLNSLFTVMDYCTALFPLYKVETIGDAYMVAGGLPEPNPNNAKDLADFALLVSAAVSACVRSPIDGSPVQIRMGCHTGNVMAGVVGTLMPRYCLFGDTVNTASRMESNGAPGEIHCSEDFAKKLLEEGKHHLEERGEISVKGKGSMNTYWLRGPTEENQVCSAQAIEEVVNSAKQLLAEQNEITESPTDPSSPA